MSEAADAESVPKTISYRSVPALVTAVLLSMVLLSGALYAWYAVGKSVRDQISWVQAATLLFFVFAMIGIMLAIGYSHIWAREGEVVIRNGPVMRRFRVEDVVGLRLRKGDPWAYLLVKDPGSEAGYRRRATLAIQSLEGGTATTKVHSLRRWLKANGASSEGIER